MSIMWHISDFRKSWDGKRAGRTDEKWCGPEDETVVVVEEQEVVKIGVEFEWVETVDMVLELGISY